MRNPIRWLLGTALAIALVLVAPVTVAAQATSNERVESIDINSAAVEELMELPGVGRAYAERIVAFRDENGPFESVEAIMNVRGIGEKTFERIRDRIRIGAAKKSRR